MRIDVGDPLVFSIDHEVNATEKDDIPMDTDSGMNVAPQSFPTRSKLAHRCEPPTSASGSVLLMGVSALSRVGGSLLLWEKWRCVVLSLSLGDCLQLS